MSYSISRQKTVRIGNPVNRNSRLNSGLTAWWLRLNSNFGGVRFFDLFGKSYATLTSGAVSNGVRARPGGLAGGIYCTAGGYLSVAKIANIVAADFTVAFWFYPVTWPGGFTSIFLAGDAAHRSPEILLDTSGNNSYTSIGRGDGVNDSFSTNAWGFAAGQWWHIILARIGTATSVYKNGLPVATSSTANGTVDSTDPWTIGLSSSGGNNPDIVYDDLRIYIGRGLNDREALALYRASRMGYPNELNWVRRGFAGKAAAGTLPGLGNYYRQLCAA